MIPSYKTTSITKSLALAAFCMAATASISASTFDENQADTQRPTSKLWQEFVQAQKENKPSTLRDYSYAGYHHGEKAIPTVDYPKVDITKYGAVANDGHSDRQAFIKAIRAAEKLARKQGGAILFVPKGTFRLHEAGEDHKPISISASNIVLRGEDRNESILFMAVPNDPQNPKNKWSCPPLVQFIPTSTKSQKVTAIMKSAPIGARTVQVKSTKGLTVGQFVAVHLKHTDDTLIDETVAPYKVNKKWRQLWDRGVMVESYLQIKALTKNTITFEEPMMTPVDTRWPWSIVAFPTLQEVGVENLTFLGNFQEKFVHHKNWLHDSGYSLLSMRACFNSWMREVTFRNVSSAAGLVASANISVLDCKVEGFKGHNSIHTQQTSRVLLANIYDKCGQWHSTGVSKPSIGTVIWRAFWTDDTCFETHSTQPRYTLLDACVGGFMRKHGGGAVGSQPTHLEGLTFWNFQETDKAEENFPFWDRQSEYWKILPPIISGFHAADGKPCTSFDQEQVLVDECHGSPVYPTSLYEAQLKLRLGQLPMWFKEMKKRPVTDQ